MAKDESYTPRWVIDAVREVLGDIALDPTGNGHGAIARHEIVAEQNTFLTDWNQYLGCDATVFMNPPYSSGSEFVLHLWRHLATGSVKAAITLTLPGLLHNKSSAWMFKSEYCRAFALPTGRINYENNGNSNDRDALFALWTGDGVSASEAETLTDRFADVFGELRSPVGSGSRVEGAIVAFPQVTAKHNHQIGILV